MIEETIPRNVFEIVDLKDADDSDYWHDRSPIERVEAIDFMRKAMFGNDRVSKRLQRVLQLLNSKEVESFKANFISKDDLLINKRASGRPKDLVDYSMLQNEQTPQLV